MVTKATALCRNQMKKCRFGVQKGVFLVCLNSICTAACADKRNVLPAWAMVHKNCAHVVKHWQALHLFTMRIGIWAIGFGVTHLISSSIMPVRHPRIQFDRLRWLWHYCCSFSTWSIGFRQRHFLSTWFIEFRKAALGFGMVYFS